MTGLPPANVETEAALLASMLNSRRAIEIATELGVTESDFSRDSHGTVYATILEADQHGSVDFRVVINRLKAANKLAQVGGAVAIVSINENHRIDGNVKAYAQEVIDQAQLRALVEVGTEISRLGYDHPDDPVALTTLAAKLVDQLGERAARSEAGWTTLADQFDPMYDEITERSKSGATMVGLPTGFADLDERWGGLQPARLYIIAGRPGMGKSALGSGIAESLALGAGVDVAVFNFEMGVNQQAKRAAARLSGVPLHRLTSGKPTQDDVLAVQAAACQGAAYTAAKRIHLDQSSDLSCVQIRQRARRLDRKLRREGRRLHAVVVDYLQLVKPPKRTENRANDIGEISRDLKAMAMELDVPVIALSQLNRMVEQRPQKRPVMSDLRESGSIENDADVIALLFRPEYYLGDETPAEWINKVEVITAKWRDGEPGSDNLGFDAPLTKFVDGDVPLTFTAGMPRKGAA